MQSLPLGTGGRARSALTQSSFEHRAGAKISWSPPEGCPNSQRSSSKKMRELTSDQTQVSDGQAMKTGVSSRSQDHPSVRKAFGHLKKQLISTAGQPLF